MPLLYPTILKNRITDITAQELKERGIRGLLLDVDNTLTRHGSQELDPAVEVWIAEMQAAGIGLTVVSNALHKRVGPFAQRIGLRFIAFSCKPRRSAFGAACAVWACRGRSAWRWVTRPLPMCSAQSLPASG